MSRIMSPPNKTGRTGKAVTASAKGRKSVGQPHRSELDGDPVMERILSSKAHSVAFLVKAGILEKSGTRLSKPYR